VQFNQRGFNRFKGYFEEWDVQHLTSSVLKGIRKYYYDEFSDRGDRYIQYEAFDERILKQTKILRQARGQTRVSTGTALESYFDNLKRGEEDPEWSLAVYYWFLTVEKNGQNGDRRYLNLIENSLYADHNADKTFEGYFGEPVPGTESIGEQKNLHWLSPYNLKSIPFVGRRKELEQLNAFAEDSAPFKMWVLTAPSGAGKTRLCHEWIQDSKISDQWDAFYIGRGEGRRLTFKDGHDGRRFTSLSGVTDRNNWDNWTPSRPTIFIIDYMHGFRDVILSLIQRCNQSRNSDAEPILHNVRLLIIDHVFPAELEELKRDLSVHLDDGEGGKQDGGSKLFFEQAALSIRETANQHQILTNIVKDRAGDDVAEGKVAEGVAFLEKMPSAQYPLFAALIGTAIKQGKDFTNWNRRDLIRFHLRGPDRLPWKSEEINGKWVSSFISVATARRGMSRQDLINCDYGPGIAKPDNFRPIYTDCQSITSSEDSKRLAPFEPDILGESFFLEFIGWCVNDSPNFHLCTRKLLEAGSKETTEQGAEAFIGFIQRLTRNLINDDQALPETRVYWENLLGFLTPTNFTPESPVRWAVSASLVEIADQIKDAKNSDISVKAQAVLNTIDADDLYEIMVGSVLESAATYAIRYYQLSANEGAISDPAPSKLLSLLLRLDSVSPKIPSVTRAIQSGNRTLIKALIDAGADIDKPTSLGSTPLMFACYHKLEDIALDLADKCEHPDAVNSEGWTALMFACCRDQKALALKLVDECENLDVGNNEGWTALMFACRYDQEAVALKLVDKCEHPDAVDNEGWAALMVACRYYQEKVALKLADRCQPDAVNNAGWTALMVACRYSQETVALKLADKCENPDAVNNEGWTALMFACRHGQEKAALKLVDKCGDMDAADDEGWTALMFACRYDLEAVALKLVDKCEHPDAVNNEGWTALMLACHYNQEKVALKLTDKCQCPDFINDVGWTALMYACHRNQENVALRLLNMNVNINHTNKNGQTILMFAAIANIKGVVRILIDRKVKLNEVWEPPGHVGFTALAIARDQKHQEIVEMLVAAGAEE